jgi:hypothetical protein
MRPFTDASLYLSHLPAVVQLVQGITGIESATRRVPGRVGAWEHACGIERPSCFIMVSFA